MTPHDCARETDVVRAVLARRLDPGEAARPGDELAAHVAACPVCRDAASLASAFGWSRDAAMRDAPVPAAGQVWWRSAVRAHADATRAARRPLVWLLGAAAASFTGIVAAVVGALWPRLADAIAVLSSIAVTLGADVSPLMESLRPSLPLIAGVVSCLVLMPVLVYLALIDERRD